MNITFQSCTAYFERFSKIFDLFKLQVLYLNLIFNVFSETMEIEPKQLPSKLQAEEELYNSETAPKLEEKPSSIFEGKTKNWLTEEYPNLDNMISVRAFQSSVNEENMLKGQNKLQKKTQNWADSSSTNKYGDADWERSSGSQGSKSVYLNGLKPHTDEILPRREPSIPEEYSIQPVTVKFLMNKTRAFTCAFGVHTYIQEVKETLSRTFRCQPIDLQLIKNGVALSDRLEISELGVEPYGTVEIEMKAKGSLKTESMYDVPIVPDVITVRVESGIHILHVYICKTLLKDIILIVTYITFHEVCSLF
ncbi:hypothetical protein B7P43_G16857 [Cryptotermes secundus]|uniref:Ubiquitin-like domain-containing protein n=1 Tax=Cryptotermes secundus TaxID=105785 RepID=A0A2J7PTJ4_9NEOP|nr:hypothetical protein B7P43_G16857 [Cryptotermes secundus]